MNTSEAQRILRETFDRIAALEERRRGLADEIRDVFTNAAARLFALGFDADPKALHELYRRHAKTELALRRRVEQLELALSKQELEAA